MQRVKIRKAVGKTYYNRFISMRLSENEKVEACNNSVKNIKIQIQEIRKKCRYKSTKKIKKKKTKYKNLLKKKTEHCA